MYLTIKPVTLLRSRADGLQARGVFSPGHSIFASRITLPGHGFVWLVSRYSSGGWTGQRREEKKKSQSHESKRKGMPHRCLALVVGQRKYCIVFLK